MHQLVEQRPSNMNLLTRTGLLKLSLVGWGFFLLMYALVGVSSRIFEFEITPSFKVLSPLGVAGLVCWSVCSYRGLRGMIRHERGVSNTLGTLISLASILAFIYVVWILIDGFS